MADEATITAGIEDELHAKWPDPDIKIRLPNNDFTPPANGLWADVTVGFSLTRGNDLASSRRRDGHVIIRLYWSQLSGTREILRKARAIANVLDGTAIGTTEFGPATIRNTQSEFSKRIEIPFFDIESGE